MYELSWTNTFGYLLNNEKVIVCSQFNGQWIKIPKESFDIITYGVRHDLSAERLLECIENEDDREYIDNIIKKLFKMGVLASDEIVTSRKVVTFILTQRCNLHCIHCCADSEFVDSHIVGDEMSTSQLKQAIDEILKYEPQYIVLTGGEPLIRLDFFDILFYLRERYKNDITLCTNGTLIDNTNAEWIARNVDAVDISMDGVNEKTCAIVRGKGVFSKVIESIRLLQSKGMNKISLSMVVGKNNSDLIPEFKELNKELGTRTVLRPFVAVGRGENSEKYFHTKTEKSEKEDSNINTSGYLRCTTCGAGSRSFTINFDGKVFPCTNLVNRYGIKGEKDISTFLNESNGFGNSTFCTLEKLLKLHSCDRCLECNVRFFCWNCMWDIFLYSKDKSLFEERCNKRYAYLNKEIWGE